jgi:hypothetical protein
MELGMVALGPRYLPLSKSCVARRGVFEQEMPVQVGDDAQHEPACINAAALEAAQGQLSADLFWTAL